MKRKQPGWLYLAALPLLMACRNKTILKSVATALSLFSLQMTCAQEKEQSVASIKKMDKTDREPISYVIPQKPEDISPLLNGEKIPKAILPDATGESFDLNKAVSEKPTILIFYRGGWCPYCSRQLSGLQQAAPELEDLGYQLIAISTDDTAGLTQSATKQLSDRILEARKKKEISQQDLGKVAKVHFSNVGKYERGEAIPAADILNRSLKLWMLRLIITERYAAG